MRANISLPTPLSPSNNTGVVVRATRLIMWQAALNAAETPINWRCSKREVAAPVARGTSRFAAAFPFGKLTIARLANGCALK